MKLNVNLLTKGHFWPSGEEVPENLVPDWCRIKHRCGDVEAAEIRQRREELRAEAAERREKTKREAAEKRKRGSARNNQCAGKTKKLNSLFGTGF